jgi:trimeric autotransporter adhesin
MYTAELLRQAQATAAAATAAATASLAIAPQLSPLQSATANGHSSSAPLLTAPLGTARQAFAAQRSIRTAAATAAAAAAAVPATAAAVQTPQSVAALLSAMEDTPWLQRGVTAAGSGRNVRSSNGRNNGFDGAATAGSKHRHGKKGFVGPESRLLDSGSLATAAAAVKVEAAERRAAAAEAQVQFAELQHVTASYCFYMLFWLA